jgi:hypothetical protein
VLLARSEASSYIEPFKGVLPLAELFGQMWRAQRD